MHIVFVVMPFIGLLARNGALCSDIDFGAAWAGIHSRMLASGRLRADATSTRVSATETSSAVQVATQPVAGLPEAMRAAHVDSKLFVASTWCEEQGAVSMNEVFEEFDEFAAALSLTVDEKQRLSDVIMARLSRSWAPGEAIVNSPQLRAALQLVVQLRRGHSGSARLGALLDRLEAQLESEVAFDWEAFLRTEKEDIWQAIGSDSDNARGTFEAVAKLLTPGSIAEELVVSSGRGYEFEGRTLGGSPASISLARGGEMWGVWPLHVVVDGPAELLGMRLVALERQSGAFAGNDAFNVLGGGIAAEPGDRLHLAPPARAAALELVTFDQLPEVAQPLAEVLQQHGEGPHIVAPPPILDAARFTLRLRQAESEGARTTARFQRLRDAPVLRNLVAHAANDALWRESWEAFASAHPDSTARLEKLYEATRGAASRARPPPKVEPRKEQVGGGGVPWNVVRIALVTLVVAAFVGVYMLGQGKKEELPTYSLDGATQTRVLKPVFQLSSN